MNFEKYSQFISKVRVVSIGCARAWLDARHVSAALTSALVRGPTRMTPRTPSPMRGLAGVSCSISSLYHFTQGLGRAGKKIHQKYFTQLRNHKDNDLKDLPTARNKD